MITFGLRVLCLAPALALLSIGASAPHAAFKCGGATQPGGKALLSIDGVIRWTEDLSSIKLPEKDIHSVDILCMDPRDSTLNRTHGWGVVSVWTKQGPAPRVEEALDVIRDEQDAHLAKHGRYILALEDIRFPESMKPVRMTMDADKSGWIARTTLPRLLRTCTMFDGTVAAPPPNQSRKTACVSDR
jgi:hypothetical protein